MTQSLLTFKSLLITALVLPLIASCGGNSSGDTEQVPFTGLWEDRVSWTEEISGLVTRSSRSGSSAEPLLIEDFGDFFMVTWCRSRVQERLDVVNSTITLPARLASSTAPARPAIKLSLAQSARIFGEETFEVDGLTRLESHEVLKLSNTPAFDDAVVSLNLEERRDEFSVSATTDTCVYSELEQTFDVSLDDLRDIIDDPSQRASDVYFDTKTLTIVTPFAPNDYANLSFSFRDSVLIRIPGNGETYDLEDESDIGEQTNLFSLTYSEAEAITGDAISRGEEGTFTFEAYNFIPELSLNVFENLDTPLTGELNALFFTQGSFNITLDDGTIVDGSFEVSQ